MIAGGLGFPVLLELLRAPSPPRRWSLHTKLTLTMTWILLLVGTLAILGFEWTNPATLGCLDLPGKLLAGFFQALRHAPPASTPSTTRPCETRRGW